MSIMGAIWNVHLRVSSYNIAKLICEKDREQYFKAYVSMC